MQLNAQDEAEQLSNRIQNNLFLNVTVSSTKCTVGEPVIATYKLYSSLNSTSTIIKDPDFAGFEYTDLVSPGDQIVAREMVGNKLFDVHILRKTQLIPTQTGVLEAGAMVLQNSISLIGNNGQKDPLLANLKADHLLQNGKYHIIISSIPVNITVTDSLIASAESHHGIKGNFDMKVALSKSTLVPSEEGKLIITISGKGDVEKIQQPAVEWPQNILVFPTQSETQDGMLNGDGNTIKRFVVPFSCPEVGEYIIPPIHFSFFNSQKKQITTLKQSPLKISVLQAAPGHTGNDQIPPIHKADYQTLFIALSIVLGLVLLFIVIRRRKTKQRPALDIPIISSNPGKPHLADAEKPAASPEFYLQEATQALINNDSLFYNVLKDELLLFFRDRFNIMPALFTQSALKNAMIIANIPSTLQNTVLQLMDRIEHGIHIPNNIEQQRTVYKQALMVLKELFVL